MRNLPQEIHVSVGAIAFLLICAGFFFPQAVFGQSSASLPDLIITAIEQTPREGSSNAYNLKITYKNAGTVPARIGVDANGSSASRTRVQWIKEDGSELGVMDSLYLSNDPNEILAAGASVAKTYPSPLRYLNAKKIYAFANDNRRVAERDYANNKFEYTPPIPDLVVTSVEQTPRTGSSNAFNFNVTYKNNGTGISYIGIDANSSGEARSRAQWIAEDGTELGSMDYLYLSGGKLNETLAPGASVTRTYPAPLRYLNAKKIFVTANDNKRVIESNYSNNRFEYTPPLPDLIITNVEQAPRTGSSNAYNFKVTYKNNGTVPAYIGVGANSSDEARSSAEFIAENGSSLGTMDYLLLSSNQYETLAPGASVTVTTMSPLKYLNAKKIKLVANYNKRVVENNYANNKFEYYSASAAETAAMQLSLEENAAAAAVANNLGLSGTSSVGTVPGDALYILKEAKRGLQKTFTFDSKKAADLNVQIANEKLLEAKVLVDKGDTKRAADNLKDYEKDISKAAELIEKISATDKEGAKVRAEKIMGDQVAGQVIAGIIESKVSAADVASVKDSRHDALEAVANAAESSMSSDEVVQVLSEQSLTGGSFSALRKAEVLGAIENAASGEMKKKVGEEKKAAIDQFKGQFKVVSDLEKAKLGDYLKNVGGDDGAYVKALDTVLSAGVNKDSLDNIAKAKSDVVSKIEERASKAADKSAAVQDLLKSLSGESVEDIRALNDIEKLSGADFSSLVSGLKDGALANTKKRISDADSAEEKKSITEELSQFADAKQLSIIKDLSESGASADILKDANDEIVADVKESLDEARGDKDDYEATLRAIVGDDADNLEAIKEISDAAGLGGGLVGEFLDSLKERLEWASDVDEIKMLKKEIYADPALVALLKSRDPQFLKDLDADPSDALAKSQALDAIDDVENYLASLKEDRENTLISASAKGRVRIEPILTAALKDVSIPLSVAKQNAGQGEYAKAYAKAQEAYSAAEKAQQILEDAMYISDEGKTDAEEAATQPSDDTESSDSSSESVEEVDEVQDENVTPDQPQDAAEQVQQVSDEPVTTSDE